MKNYYSTDKLLKNVNVFNALQVGTGKNPTTPLHSNTKIKFFLNEKKYKNNKNRTCF